MGRGLDGGARIRKAAHMTDTSHGGADREDEVAGRPTGRLALAFQEAFTVAVRLRSNRQVGTDGASFRGHVKQLLLAADRDARHAGYDARDVRMAVYAFIAFLDESVLNSSNPMFADWPRKPLQEEVFGDHRAGETFFENLRQILSGPDSSDTADLLEVYLLCLLLGFRGRFSSDSGEVHALVSRTRDKITRVRGATGELSPAWAPPEGESVPGIRDPWIRRLGLGAIACFALALVLWGLFGVLLGPRVGDARNLAGLP